MRAIISTYYGEKVLIVVATNPDEKKFLDEFFNEGRGVVLSSRRTSCSQYPKYQLSKEI